MLKPTSQHRKPPSTPEDRLCRNRKLIANPRSQSPYAPPGTYALAHSSIVYITKCTNCYKHYIGEMKHALPIGLQQHMDKHQERATQDVICDHSPNHLIISGSKKQILDLRTEEESREDLITTTTTISSTPTPPTDSSQDLGTVGTSSPGTLTLP